MNENEPLAEAVDTIDAPPPAPDPPIESPAPAASSRTGGAMSPRIAAGTNLSASAQNAAAGALASGKRNDLLSYLRLRRQSK